MIRLTRREMVSLMIRTERLLIREYEKKDAAGLYEILKNPPVHCFMDEKLDSMEEAEKAVLKRQGKGEWYAVCLADSDTLIGELFADKEGEDTYSIGWNFNLKFGKKGYAAEAARAMMDSLFRADARRIYAYAEEDNLASRRLCEKLGMRQEGLFLEFISFVKGEDGAPIYENTCQYAILKREWEQGNKQ